MNKCLVRLLGVILVSISLGGCSSHPKRVDCDGHLRPINSGAAAQADRAVHP